MDIAFKCFMLYGESTGVGSDGGMARTPENGPAVGERRGRGACAGQGGWLRI
jgi:hypothetical protein